MLLVGIDEAGYGPLLGPLVVSSVAMSLPEELAGISLWQLLSGGLTNRAASAKGRLVIADSKKVYHAGTRNVKELERSTLAAVRLATQTLPETFEHLLRTVSLEPDPHLTHRWYCHRPLTLPCRVALDGLRLSAGLVTRELAEVGAKIVAVRAVPLVEKRYNFLVHQTKNKSEVLFGQTARLIASALETVGEKQIRIAVDKQGGKDHYTRDLLKMFPDARLSVIKEAEDESEYQLGLSDGRHLRLTFSKKGEQKHLLVAWASLVGKYLRELFMAQFNAFWAGHDPNLHPTAGYWEDGRQFMRDVAPILTRLNIPSADLIRQL